MQQLLIFWTKCPRRADHEIGPDQTARLIVDRPRQAVAKRPDADQRRDAERDRDGKEQEPAPARPAIPPRHFPDEGRTHKRWRELPACHLKRSKLEACSTLNHLSIFEPDCSFGE